MNAPLRFFQQAVKAGIFIVLEMAAFPANALTHADFALRYKLEVGQQLDYEASSTFGHETGSFDTKAKITLWVVGKNADGSWQILSRAESRMSFGTNEKPRPADVTLTEFSLFPNGRVVSTAQEARDLGQKLFLEFPDDPDKLKTGWEIANKAHDETLSIRRDSRNDEKSGEWVFAITTRSLLDEIYLSTSSMVAWFDAKRGVMEKNESETTQGYGFKGKGRGSTELKSSGVKDVAWCEKFSGDLKIYFDARRQYFKALSDMPGSGWRTVLGVIGSDPAANALESLKGARGRTTNPFVQEAFDQLVQHHDQTVKYSASDTERVNEILDKRSYDWQANDLGGKLHSLADYRGKVVLLDFWYRGCGWCMRAMPQIEEVADHYKGKPVVVLGMNTDSQIEDARFVVEKMKLTYPVLRAKAVADNYRVHAFPTFIIIDQEGTVRDVHAGYSPDLRDMIIKEIDPLLTGGN